jgi:hypothetical protein
MIIRHNGGHETLQLELSSEKNRAAELKQALDLTK